MKRSLLGALILCSCRSDAPREGSTSGWVEHENRFARCFQVFGKGEQRRVIIYGSPDRADTLKVLTFGKGEWPSPERLAVMSTTHLPFIEAIGQGAHVIAASSIQRLSEGYWRRRAEEGSLAELTGANGNDDERMVALRIDAILDYPFGREQVRHGPSEALRIPVTEYLEDHPLGRAEWIRFFGSLLGAEHAADSVFEAIVGRYLARVRGSGIVDRPSVFFGSAWQGAWHVPSGQSYMARLIGDAGGDYLFASTMGPANQSMTLEAVVSSALKADRFGVIMAHGVPVKTIDMTGDARLASMPVLRSGAFYLDSERSDIFGKALLEPDVLLEELGCVFRDTACDGSRHRYVFRPVQ